MNKVIRIGTRDSELALWQAKTVQSQLKNLGYKTQLVPVKSTGDLVLDKPLYEMGITGIFTKTLDIAMLKGTVDVAVHSMKDVPTALPKGIIQAAVLARAETEDMLVSAQYIDYTKPCTIATGSLRRKAQWLNRYPHHTAVDLRGNVQTRLQKLLDNNWDGAIFAKAGLERLGYLHKSGIKSPDFNGFGEELPWMLPAPAQGAMVVVAMEKDTFCQEALAKINHTETEKCTKIERDFLRTLEGGCTAPIGALAEVVSDKIQFKGCLFSLGGKKKLEVATSVPHGPQGIDLGNDSANKLLENGGKELMEIIKREMKQ
ncbi:hydroxymethylbilane synthase [Marinirhabdus gelatinilytica]|uniref:Hydroxymethylbilane synthase n=1 Tax=Marinirhabdus gelatinilytica TaxID=1703343 RepID=A0A370QJP8_9FLAO|nr:hydroxymethylbilane synthase [Marinirhabdus gelatinilytica]RDK88597.1 hydroxymethylbilane synthase [Marinirhabdus gelatinilytica]